LQYFYFLFKKFAIITLNLNKGYKMSIVIKNAENFFERFENKLEEWAEKIL